MSRALSAFSALAFFCLAVGCKEQAPPESDSISIEIQPEDLADFHDFIEALQVLIADRQGVRICVSGVGERDLYFCSSTGFPIDPKVVHISPDQAAVGSGGSRIEFTLEELRSDLVAYDDAAAMADAPSVILLFSDKGVSGDFGFSVLKLFSDVGIDLITLHPKAVWRPKDIEPMQKKPSPPSSRLTPIQILED